ncbi:MAG: hypothetical protein ACRDSZ_15355 [Pseudonocardiaceae bacterium]
MRISRDGWVSFPAPSGFEGLHVRARRADDGRLEVTDLFVHAEVITPAMLRQVSLSRVEAALNAPADDYEDYLGQTLAAYSQSWAVGGRGSWADDELTVAKLRMRSPKSSGNQAKGRTRLTRPGGQDPDNFYRLVAHLYRDHAASTRAPAKELAAEAGVPVTTAHRWIREARRRGFLPPARKGKVG